MPGISLAFRPSSTSALLHSLLLSNASAACYPYHYVYLSSAVVHSFGSVPYEDSPGTDDAGVWRAEAAAGGGTRRACGFCGRWASGDLPWRAALSPLAAQRRTLCHYSFCDRTAYALSFACRWCGRPTRHNGCHMNGVGRAGVARGWQENYALPFQQCSSRRFQAFAFMRRLSSWRTVTTNVLTCLRTMPARCVASVPSDHLPPSAFSYSFRGGEWALRETCLRNRREKRDALKRCGLPAISLLAARSLSVSPRRCCGVFHDGGPSLFCIPASSAPGALI